MITRETEKIITIGSSEYKIGCLDAWSGSNILFSLLQRFAPAITESMMGFSLPGGRSEMTEEEFTRIQQKCLDVVDIKLKAGWTSIVGLDGYLLDDLKNDIPTICILTVEVLKFNLGSFFSEESRKALGIALEGTPFADMLI